jgi:hypothetical protein
MNAPAAQPEEDAGSPKRRSSLPVPRRELLRLGDRRFSRRYPIIAELEFQAIGDDGLRVKGLGRSIDLSTGGVLFEVDQILREGALRKGMPIELVIAWPARLNRSLALNLCVSGRVARSHGTMHAVRMRDHDFCLRGRYRLGGLRFRSVAVPQVAASCPA